MCELFLYELHCHVCSLMQILFCFTDTATWLSLSTLFHGIWPRTENSGYWHTERSPKTVSFSMKSWQPSLPNLLRKNKCQMRMCCLSSHPSVLEVLLHIVIDLFKACAALFFLTSTQIFDYARCKIQVTTSYGKSASKSLSVPPGDMNIYPREPSLELHAQRN